MYQKPGSSNYAQQNLRANSFLLKMTPFQMEDKSSVDKIASPINVFIQFKRIGMTNEFKANCLRPWA